MEKCQTVEQMCMFTDEKIRGIFYSHDDDNELAQILFAQYRRLCMALNILCSYVGMYLEKVVTFSLIPPGISGN